MTRHPRRPSRRSVRVRTTALAVIVVGVALVVASVGMLVAVRRAEVDRVRTGAELRAADLATALDAGLPAVDLALDEGEDRFIQIVAGGQVVAASDSVDRAESLVGEAGTDRAITAAGDADDRWVITTAATTDGRFEVVVGRELDGPRETVSTLVALLVAGVPLLLVVVGATTWHVAGRALAPVEAIRREADEIGTGGLHRRVPVPDGDDEVARLATTVNSMLDRLEQGQRRQQRFVSDASHELRSPVAVIRQHAELAAVHPEETSLDQLSETVLAESDVLAALVDDLIVLARTDEGALLEDPTPVDLDDLVLDAAERVGGDIEIDRADVSGAQVRGAPRLLQRAVRNLVENAAAHAEHRVVVALRESDGRAILTVDDDGPGIAPEDRERVFERFVRLDESRSRSGGTGLGLAIVRAVVEVHAGSVHIDDAPIGGTRVVVALPSAD